MIKTNKNVLKAFVASTLLLSGVVLSANATNEVVKAAEFTYKLVTDVNELAPGDRVVISAADFNFALSTVQNDNNRGQAAITKNSDETISLSDDVQVITLENGTVEDSFAFNVGSSGYLYAASSSKNYLRTEVNISADSSWSISVSPDTAVASISALGNNTKNVLQYNQSASIFSCYSTSQKAIQLYKETAISFVEFSACLHYCCDELEDIILSSSSETGLLTKPEDPVRNDGYVFAGWYTEETFENLFDFDTKLTSDIDLYAKWVSQEDTYLDSTKASLGFSYTGIGNTFITKVADIEDDEYVLAYNDNGTYKAINNIISNNKLTISDFSSDSSKFTISKTEEGYTVQDETGKYLGVTSSTNVSLSTNESIWNFDEQSDGSIRLVSSSSPTRCLSYNGSVVGNYSTTNSSGYIFGIVLIKLGNYTFSNYALRFGTAISSENYAKLGTVVDYGVLMLPTDLLAAESYDTFKEMYEDFKDMASFDELFNDPDYKILNIKKGATEGSITLQENDGIYSFGAVLKNIPETALKMSVSAVCYVINDEGKVYFAEQRNISIAEMVDVYASGDVEGIDEATLSVVNELKNYIATL